MELAARECGWWMLRIFLWMQYMHMYIVWYLLWNHVYNCLFRCVYFFIYIIYLKKCLQKHKPTRNVTHSEVKKNLLSKTVWKYFVDDLVVFYLMY